MTETKRKFQLNAFQIKIIALITMTLDHFSKYQTFTLNRTFNDILGIIGRIAAPLFLFMVVEGLRHTRSNRYLRKAGFEIMKSIIQHKPFGDPVYEFIQKKRNEGKCAKEAMIAGLNKFLRIYYGKVMELYSIA